MTLEWVEAKQAEYNKKYEGYPDVIFNMYYELDEDIKAMIHSTIEDNIKYYIALTKLKAVSSDGLPDDMEKDLKWIFNKLYFTSKFAADFAKIDTKNEKDDNNVKNLMKCYEFYSKFSEICEDYFEFLTYGQYKYYSYLDCSPVEYDGEDIVITDPCYLISDIKLSDEDEEKFENAWEDGTFKGTQSSTIYGDWSCTAWDMNTKKPIGEFCADGGMVCVVDTESIKKFNPNFDWYETRPWTTTIIRNFKGMAQIKIKEEVCHYEEDYEGHWKKGDEYIEYICYVEGHGVNSETGEPIDFITSQTGL